AVVGVTVMALVPLTTVAEYASVPLANIQRATPTRADDRGCGEACRQSIGHGDRAAVRRCVADIADRDRVGRAGLAAIEVGGVRLVDCEIRARDHACLPG